MRTTITCLLLAACSSGPSVPDDAALGPDGSPPPLEVHCGWDPSCPEVLVAGDPHATIGTAPSPFRGYGDPSLEHDDAGTLWLSYSWLDVVTSAAGNDLAVRTHLARGEAGGFSFVRAVNEVTSATEPDTGASGWTFHEVSTITRRPDGTWEDLWLDYFEGAGETAGRAGFRFAHSVAAAPAGLGDSAEPIIRGSGTSASFGGTDLSGSIPELSDCAAFTEPDLFTDGGRTFLAMTCVVIDGSVQDFTATRLVLLEEQPSGWRYLGVLLDGADPARFGADTLEQADLSRARDGTLLLIVTPIRKSADPMHQGCLVLEVESLDPASVRRGADGAPVVRARLTGDGNLLGPGLCTYDAACEGGILMVLTRYDLVSSPPDIVLSLRATGVHP